MSEDFYKEFREHFDKKSAENTKVLLDKFRSEVEREGAKMELLIKYGDTRPKIYISGKISAALEAKINDFASQYLPDSFWDQ